MAELVEWIKVAALPISLASIGTVFGTILAILIFKGLEDLWNG